MKLDDLLTKEDLLPVLEQIRNMQQQFNDSKLGFISHDQLKEETGLGDSTLWRMVEKYQAFKAYKFKGSNKKFYKISELEIALEKGY